MKPNHCHGCSKPRICGVILADCMFAHEIISGNAEARNALFKATKTKEILAVFNRFTNRRVIFGNGRDRPTIIIPASQKEIERERKKTMQEVQHILNKRK